MNYYQLPYSESTITQPFRSGKHYGVDFAPKNALGQTIWSVCDGTVFKVGNGKQPGNFVIVHADDGKYVYYAHLRYLSTLVKGARVLKGKTVIGIIGSTGQALGPHLHLAINTRSDWTYANYLNPLTYIKARLEPTYLPAPVEVAPVEVAPPEPTEDAHDAEHAESTTVTNDTQEINNTENIDSLRKEPQIMANPIDTSNYETPDVLASSLVRNFAYTAAWGSAIVLNTILAVAIAAPAGLLAQVIAGHGAFFGTLLPALAKANLNKK